MYYIHPIPDAHLEVLEILENDEYFFNEITRIKRDCDTDLEI